MYPVVRILRQLCGKLADWELVKATGFEKPVYTEYRRIPGISSLCDI